MDLQRQKNSEYTRANGAKSKCGELMKGKAKSKMWNTSVTLKKKKKVEGVWEKKKDLLLLIAGNFLLK